MKESEQRVPIVGQIIKVSKHPNADRLYLAMVDVGKETLVSIIFGGNRILSPGNLVAVALPGVRLPSGDKIRPRKYRGIRSGGGNIKYG